MCLLFCNSYKVSVLKQFQAVFWRCWLVNVREPMLMRARVVQSIVSETLRWEELKAALVWHSAYICRML